MKEMTCDNSLCRHSFIRLLEITVLAIFMLVSIANASPFAYVTTPGSNNISVIDTATRNVIYTIPVGNFPQGVAVSLDGKHVYVANSATYDSTVSVIDTGKKNVISTVHIGSWPLGIAVSPDGKKVYVTNVGSDTVSVIDTGTNNVTATVPVGNGPEGVAVSPDGKYVYVVNFGDNTISLIDTSTNRVTANVNVARDPGGVAVSPNGKYVYVTAQDGPNATGTVSIIDTTKNNTVLPPVPVGRVPFGVDVSPDGKYVYVANMADSTVSIIDTSTRNVTDTIRVGDRATGIAFTPDGKYVYVGCLYSTLYIIDTSTRNVTDTITVGNDPGAILTFGKFIGPDTRNFYTVNVTGVNYQCCNWGQYPLINLFGEKNVPLLSNGDPIWKSHANKLAKLVIDSDSKLVLKTGEKLDLGQGYTLEAKQVDIDGKKVWIEFDKDGQYVDDQIVSTDSGDHTWTCKLDNVQGEDNVPVLKVHVNQVFQGAVDSVAQIDGIWLIDYANATTLNVGDQFGKYTFIAVNPGLNASYLGILLFGY